MNHFFRVVLLFTLALLPVTAHAVELTVAAAASLQDSLTEVAKLYESRPANKEQKDLIVLNFGASGALSQQIMQGAPIDVFVAAAALPVDALDKAGKILPGTRKILLQNALVLIAPKANKSVGGLADLAKSDVKKVAIGEPATVPAGMYAEETFKSLNLSEAVRTKLVFGQSVRQVLTYVETANVDTGIVFATDAQGSDKVRIVAQIKPSTHSPIVYPVAVIKTTKHEEAARRFATFLNDKEAQAVFTRFGFKLGPNPS